MERSVFAADAGPGLLVVTSTTTTVSTHSFVFVTIDVVLTLVAAVPTFILTNLLALSITRLNLTFSSRSPSDSLSRFFQRQICNKKTCPDGVRRVCCAYTITDIGLDSNPRLVR